VALAGPLFGPLFGPLVDDDLESLEQATNNPTRANEARIPVAMRFMMSLPSAASVPVSRQEPVRQVSF
jgi:hypothetical protein